VENESGGRIVRESIRGEREVRENLPSTYDSVKTESKDRELFAISLPAIVS
jgi:hypothetical protein